MLIKYNMNSFDKQFKPIKKDINSDIEYATLNLYTTESIASANNTQFIWRNVSMKQVLGSLYAKYSKFSLLVSCIIYSTASATLGVSTADDLSMIIYLKGLNFINTKELTKALIACTKLTRSVTGQQITPCTLKNVFEVSSDIVDLQLNFVNFAGAALNSNGVDYPNFVLQAILTPISGSEREGFI